MKKLKMTSRNQLMHTLRKPWINGKSRQLRTAGDHRKKYIITTW